MLNEAVKPICGGQVFAGLGKTYDMECLHLLYTPLLTFSILLPEKEVLNVNVNDMILGYQQRSLKHFKRDKKDFRLRVYCET